MRFPYTSEQIAELVRVEKYPRDWEPFEFTKVGEASRHCSSWLARMDGKTDRVRLTVRAGRVELPDSFAAALILENERIRGIDYHAVARSRFYKEVIPKGWHEDVIDPNQKPAERGRHQRVALPEFAPLDLVDFLKKVCIHWNILLPAESETLL